MACTLFYQPWISILFSGADHAVSYDGPLVNDVKSGVLQVLLKVGYLSFSGAAFL